MINGSAFVAVVASTGVMPGSDPTRWLLFAAKGDRGNQGDPGLTGAQGPIGLQGIQGPKGDTGSQGPSGTTGQAAFTAVTSTKTQISVLNQVTDIGLSGTLNVPGPNAVITLATDGAIQINSLVGGQTTVVNILLYVDNVTFLAGRQYIVSNNTGFQGGGTWSFMTSIGGLTAGSHTFRVFAQLAGGTATAVVGDTPGSLLRGTLTAALLNR